MQLNCSDAPYPKSIKHQGRSTQSQKNPSIWMETLKKVQGNRETLGKTNDRRLFYSLELPYKDLWSWLPNPKATTTDALIQTWPKKGPCLHSPFGNWFWKYFGASNNKKKLKQCWQRCCGQHSINTDDTFVHQLWCGWTISGP